MDITSLVNTLMSGDSLNGISQLTNTSSQETQNVLSAALPMLLNGAQAQSQDTSTADGFGNALFTHGKQDTSNLTSFLQGVDLEDGDKIIGHLLGANQTSAVNEIASQTGVSTKSTGTILAAVAPLLLSLLGQQLGCNNANSNAGLVGSLATSLLGGMNMNSLLGGLLGGGSMLGGGSSLFGGAAQQPLQQQVYQQPLQQQIYQQPLQQQILQQQQQQQILQQQQQQQQRPGLLQAILNLFRG